MSTSNVVASLAFGGNRLTVAREGSFTLVLVHGGEWLMDLDGVRALDSVLAEIEAGSTQSAKAIGYRTSRGDERATVTCDGKRIVVDRIRGRSGYFLMKEVPAFRRAMRSMLAPEAPYGQQNRITHPPGEGGHAGERDDAIRFGHGTLRT